MSNEENQDPCAVSTNPNENNNQQLAQSVGLATSIAPTIKVEDVTLEGTVPQDTSVIVNMSFVEGIASPEALRWYDDADYSQFLRVRVIACFGPDNSQKLDFASQRINEFSEDLMNTQGVDGAEHFLDDLIMSTDPSFFPPTTGSLASQNFTEVVSSFFTAMGPFEARDLTLRMQNAQTKTSFYSGSLSDVVVYDSPIEDLFDLDEDGRQKRQVTPEIITTGARDDQESQQHYVTEKAFLKPVVFRLMLTIRQMNDGASTVEIGAHLSLYSFMYFDYREFFDEYNAGDVPVGVEQDYTALETGMGFINSATLMGRKTFFKPQMPGQVPLGPIDPTSRITADGTKLQDVRSIGSNIAPPIDHSVFQSLDAALQNSELTQQQMKFINRKDYFSSFWVSKDSTDSARFLFAFDKRAFLSQNSLFPSLYQSDALSAELLRGSGSILTNSDGVKILHINAKKKGVHFEEYGVSSNGLSIVRNKPTEDSYRLGETIVPEVSRISSLSPVSYDIDFFEGKDSYEKEFMAQDVVRYQYGVDIAIHDPSIKFLQRLSTTLSAYEKSVREVYEMIINSPPKNKNEMTEPGGNGTGIGLYDPQSGRRTTALSEIIVGDDMTAEDILQEAIGTTASYMSQIAFPNERNSARGLSNDMRVLSNSSNPYGIKEVADIIMNFVQYLGKILETTMPENPLGEPDLSRSDVYQGTDSNAILRVDKYFEEIFEYGRDYGNGYDYMFGEESYDSLQQLPGIPRISRNQFQERLTIEFSKYFGLTVPSVLFNAESPFGASAAVFADAAYQFITPRLIRTYGADSIDQTIFRNMETNEISYDINRYASLFANLQKIKSSTKYLNYPYYYLPNTDGVPSEGSDGVRPLLHNLYKESCQVFTGSPGGSFVNLNISEDRGGITALDVSPGLSDNQLEDESGLDLLGSLLGSLSLGEQQYRRDLNNEFERGTTSEENLETPTPPQHPIKLLFGIFGEMNLSEGTNTTYQEIAAISDRLGLRQENIIPSLEGNQTTTPNQYKAMLVMGAAPNSVSVGASGLQAVRVKLEDVDPAPPARSINIIHQGDEYPPYTQTSDPMRIFSKFAAFWMNYKQLAVIEYLSDFQSPSDDFSSLGLPQWNKFSDANFIESGEQTLLCRVRPISQGDIRPESNLIASKKDLFDLDFYNQYFILEAGN